jgi:hypothetical protein
VSPEVIERLPISRFHLWEEQALRIAEHEKEAANG